MIQDSIPWKEELLRVAARLDKKRVQKRWTERSGYLMERDIMISAYSMRRLIDAWKVSDGLSSRNFRVQRFPLLDRAPDFMNKYFFWELFDLDAATVVDLSLGNLCNQIIHSWMWSLSATEQDEFDGIYVSSDRSCSSILYHIPIDQYVAIIRDIGREDIIEKRMERDATGQFKAVWIKGVLRS
jgi:hypothetical protein